MRMHELENNLETTERKADMYRLKNQELKDIIIKESADMLAKKSKFQIQTPMLGVIRSSSPRATEKQYGDPKHTSVKTPRYYSPSSQD